MALIEIRTGMTALEGDLRVWDPGQLVDVSDELALVLCSEPEDAPRATLRDDLVPAPAGDEGDNGQGDKGDGGKKPGPGTTAPGPQRGTRRVVGPAETR